MASNSSSMKKLRKPKVDPEIIDNSLQSISKQGCLKNYLQSRLKFEFQTFDI